MLVNQHFKTLRFSLLTTDPRAFLSGQRDDGQSFTVQMKQSCPGCWFADVPLSEGTYRLRYYCGDEHHVIYCGPAHFNTSRQDGLDAVVVVDRPLLDALLLTLPPALG